MMKTKQPYISGKTLHPSAKRLMDYKRQLKALVKRMRKETEREVMALFRSETYSDFKAENAAMVKDESIGSQARITMNYLLKKFTALFTSKSKQLSESMVKGVMRDNKVTLNESVKSAANKSDNPLALKSDFVPSYLNDATKEAIKVSIAENISLIKNIPEQYMTQVTGDVMRAITTNANLQDIQESLIKRGGVTERRAKNIAEDQVRKASNVINAERMKAIGVKKFEWIHSGGGQKPRELHVEMDGNIYSFDDLPVIDEKSGRRGLPGQEPGCRCTMRPIFDFELTEEKDDSKA